MKKSFLPAAAFPVLWLVGDNFSRDFFFFLILSVPVGGYQLGFSSMSSRIYGRHRENPGNLPLLLIKSHGATIQSLPLFIVMCPRTF